MGQDFRTWPARYRHWKLDVAESEDHYHWLITAEVRHILPNLRADKALEHAYGSSIRRLDTGPKRYISENALARELKRMGGQESLRLLAWLAKDVIEPGRRKRGEKPGVHDRFGQDFKESDKDEAQARHIVPPVIPASPKARAKHHQPRPPAPALSWKRLLATEIVGHWRGQITLARAFFRSGLALVVWVFVVFYLLSRAKDISTYSGEYVLRQWLILFLVLALAAGFAWWCVGVGRSALRWHQSGGGILVSLSAFVVACSTMVITSVVVVLASFVWLLGLVHTVTIRPPPAEVLHDPVSRRIILRGALNFGSYKALEQALRQKPRLTLLQVESPGGSVIEGIAMARLIQEFGMDTVTFEHCESACTLLVAAGKERYLGDATEVGFHRSWIFGKAFSTAWSSADHWIADYYRSRGIAEPFVQQALDTPSYSMWYPTPDQLIGAGFATTYWTERGTRY